MRDERALVPLEALEAPDSINAETTFWADCAETDSRATPVDMGAFQFPTALPRR